MSTPTSAPTPSTGLAPASAPSGAYTTYPRTVSPADDDLRRDVHSALAGRQELGPTYGEHFADALVERLNAHIQREVKRQLQRQSGESRGESRHLTSSQRLGLAIPSLIFLIPLVAIAGAFGSLTGVVIACVAVVAVNIAAGLF